MLMGAQIGNVHTLKDLGLYLKVGSPMISGAEPETMLVNVPGSDFILDLSRALDGEVHYKQRTIKLELICKSPKKQWSTIQSALEMPCRAAGCGVSLMRMMPGTGWASGGWTWWNAGARRSPSASRAPATPTSATLPPTRARTGCGTPLILRPIPFTTHRQE